jgi:hypothetical protein
VLIHLAFPETKSEPMIGKVTDRSVGGLGITVKRKFESGTILIVRPITSLEETPWRQIEVMDCQRARAGWRLHCRFVTPLPDPVLLLFG